MEQTLQVKKDRLYSNLKEHQSLLIAFSGGVDSSYLAFAAAQAVGHDRVLAVTARSQTFPERELNQAIDFCRTHDIVHRIIVTDELEQINSHGNPKDRCYFCKHMLFTDLRRIATAEGYSALAEGSNLDDDADYRPGRRAVRELGVLSPLKDAGLMKTDIRALSREAGLSSWDKPAFACLTSRFPYDVTITQKALSMIDAAENFLLGQGFRQCRVRHYGEKARIEVERSLLPLSPANEKIIIEKMKAIGYSIVEIDPEGYRTGSMNTF